VGVLAQLSVPTMSEPFGWAVRELADQAVREPLDREVIELFGRAVEELPGLAVIGLAAVDQCDLHQMNLRRLFYYRLLVPLPRRPSGSRSRKDGELS
jgi:hypothetical protein